ncbi:hypothetical protein EUGRSUZ_A01078 [Eucalyptus grandis]|uniref:Uncharacterized protein n=2 Tax=Eucalyptus grandis TaxID=71139 RepID=A0ACC3M3X8_EUCGR|nr:hypothetical protein EUGRSUZ_A01078 [Eucalyptus grandis]
MKRLGATRTARTRPIMAMIGLTERCHNLHSHANAKEQWIVSESIAFSHLSLNLVPVMQIYSAFFPINYYLDSNRFSHVSSGQTKATPPSPRP